MTKVQIKRAIVSVHDKSYLSILADYFLKYKVEVLSTGGTAHFLKKYSLELKLIEISEFTNFNEILGGRVKSLHPHIHSGILGKKNDKNHIKELKKIKVPFIDLVVVNLYPFENIVNDKNAKRQLCIENIDIGGPSLIRGAAKNYDNVTVLTNPNQYNSFLDVVESNRNHIPKSFREYCAIAAFEHTSYYDGVISKWFNKKNPNFCDEKLSLNFKKISQLRYGENPHQRAALFELKKNPLIKISGKDLSFNNIYDIEIAMELAQQFQKSSCVILKHGNPCGVALNKKQHKAFDKALNCDKVSAFGGIIAFNKKLSLETAQKIKNLFVEVVIAPGFSVRSKEILSKKKNLVLIQYNKSESVTSLHLKTTRNFLLVQNRDDKVVSKKDLKIKTTIKPTASEKDDMIFSFIVAKYLNSNAIVLSKNLTTVGIGVGQMNRLESAKQAIRLMKSNFNKCIPIMASDGFFPFPDIVKLCSKNNIKGIIQPGGSKNDQEVIKVANENKISMVLTGIRHFKH